MKFKMPKSKTAQSEVDRKAPAPEVSSRPDSDASKVASSHLTARDRSVIYDPSRIVKAPYPNTAVRMAGTAKRSRSGADSARAILIAAALPLSAAAVFLLLSGQNVNIGITIEDSVPNQVSDGPGDVQQHRAHDGPVAKATLPLAAPTPLKMQTVSADLVVRLPSSGPSDTQLVAKPTSNTTLIFNEFGELESPYSLTFDENGTVIHSQSRSETEAIFPAIDLGVRGHPIDFNMLAPIAEFKPPNPLTATILLNDSMRRIYTKKVSDPEFAQLIESLKQAAMARLNLDVATLKSFVPRDGASHADGLTELSWLKKAALFQRITGEKQLSSRIDQTFRAWAQTYEPSGDITLEAPLSDYIYAYSLMRDNSPKDTVLAVDYFLTRIITRQFEYLHMNKFYDMRHAMFIANTIAVGIAIKKVEYQWYAFERFNQHVINSPAFNRPGRPTRADIDTYAKLLEALITFDQAQVLKDNSNTMNRMASYMDRLLTAQLNPSFTVEHKASLAEVLKQAVYFRPALLPLYVKLQATVGGLNDDERLSRHGSTDALLNLAKRYTESYSLSEARRVPSNVPRTLPQKTPQR